MEIDSTEDKEINLYDDLLKFNEMSPEERVAAVNILAAKNLPSEGQTAASTSESAQPVDETGNESAAFNFILSDTPEPSESFGSSGAEGNDMIFVLSDTETQTASANDQSSGFVLSYQDQTYDEPAQESSFPGFANEQAEQSSFSGFSEEPQNIQQPVVAEQLVTEPVIAEQVIAEQPAPVAYVKEPDPPVAEVFNEAPQDFFTPGEPSPQPLVSAPQEPQELSASNEVSAPAGNIFEETVEETKAPAPKATDKQGVRITVREETAGSVTLSVADILGEDDFNDDVSTRTESVTEQPDSLQRVEASQIDEALFQPEANAVEPASSNNSEPLHITDFLFESAIAAPIVEEVATIAETPITEPFDQLSEAPVAFEEIVDVDELPKITSSSNQFGFDSAKLDEMLTGSKPLKITGFLNKPEELDNELEDVEESTDVICPECGHISKSSDLLCLECGAFFDEEEAEPQSKLTCADCGEDVATDEVFCPVCGSILLAH